MTIDCPESGGSKIPPFVSSLFSPELLPDSFFGEFSLCLLDLTRLAAAMADDANTQHLHRLLSPQEIDLFSGFSYPKRRVEWLGGRLAAKNALWQNHPQWRNWCDLSILPQEHGQPIVRAQGQGVGNICVSISHSADYAVAVTSDCSNCGVDIQHCTERLARVQERFASADEIELLQQEPEDLCRLGLLWAAKEAMKKCFLATDPSFFGKIRLVKANKTDQNIWQFQCEHNDQGSPAVASVQVFTMQKYAIAVVVGDRNARITRG